MSICKLYICFTCRIEKGEKNEEHHTGPADGSFVVIGLRSIGDEGVGG